MQADLQAFLARLASTVAMTLVPVALIALLTMPSSLHRHALDQAIDPHAPLAHMT
jgi:hypothetical protein